MLHRPAHFTVDVATGENTAHDLRCRLHSAHQGSGAFPTSPLHGYASTNLDAVCHDS